MEFLFFKEVVKQLNIESNMHERISPEKSKIIKKMKFLFLSRK